MIDIVFLDKKANFNGYMLIEGFPGYGLVGTISVNYLIEKLNMELVGYVESNLFPPISAIHGGMPLPPMRMYKSDKYKVVAIMSEFIMSMKSIHFVANAVYEWCHKNGIKKIISLGGISIHGKQDEVFGIASEPKDVKMFEKIGVLPIKEGATTGVNALLLTKASMGGKVPVISLLAEAKPDYIDPMGAALVLTSLSDYLGIRIDTEELVKEAMVIESKLRNSLNAARQSEKTFKEPGAGHESMYA